MTFKDRAAQIIELLLTALTRVSLTMGLMRMKTTLLDHTRPTFRTAHAVRPAQVANHCKAFGVVYQLLEVDHARILSESLYLLEIR